MSRCAVRCARVSTSSSTFTRAAIGRRRGLKPSQLATKSVSIRIADRLVRAKRRGEFSASTWRKDIPTCTRSRPPLRAANRAIHGGKRSDGRRGTSGYATDGMVRPQQGVVRPSRRDRPTAGVPGIAGVVHLLEGSLEKEETARGRHDRSHALGAPSNGRGEILPAHAPRAQNFLSTKRLSMAVSRFVCVPIKGAVKVSR